MAADAATGGTVRPGAAALAVAVLLPLLWLMAVRLAVLHGVDVEHDGFYHVAMADLGPRHCLARTFPAMTLSVWRDRFSDKELMFHLILCSIRAWERVPGGAGGPPFHVPAMAFCFGVLAAFVWTASHLGARRLWAFALLLAAVSPFFTLRLVTLRPHLLAVLLMLLSCLQFERIRQGGSLWRAAVVGFVFAWAYSNPHFVLLPACAFAVVTWPGRARVAVLLPLVTAAGIAAGYALHPQVPNTFLNWKIQCVDVVLESLRHRLPVSLGNELSAPDGRWLRQNAGVAALLLLNAALAADLWRSGRLTRLRPPVLAVLMVAAVAGAGVFVSRRALEYACPFTVLASALLVTDWMKWHPARWDRVPRRVALVAAGVVLAVATVVAARTLSYSLRDAPGRPCAGFAAWADRTGLPAGTVIANLAWADFPVLFYSAPQFRYLFGLDPMFAYRYRPVEVGRIERFRTGREWLSPPELMQLTGARIAFVSHFGWQLAKALAARGYVVVYQGTDGWAFDLAAPAPGSAPAT